MSRTLLAFSSIVVFIVLLASVNDNQLYSDVDGAPAGYTGSPADGRSCTSCHSGTAIPITGWITSNIPAEGYAPGQTYTITATATQTNCMRFGFEISPQKTNGTEVGTLAVTSSTTTQITGTKYITHKEAGTTGTTTKTWTFNWVAPVAGTGSFIFYGAFNCANNDGTDNGDKIYLSTLSVNECSYTPQITSNSGSLNSCNGQALQLTVAGASSYQWSNTATTSQISAASTGSYAVTANDANGCPGNASTNVTISNITLGQTHTDATCGISNGSINLTTAGGITPYTFHWSNGATTQNLTGVAGDTSYTVTVTDGINCTKTISVSIIQGTVPSVTATPVNTTCGNANGEVTLSVSGGNSPYTYSWNTNSTTQNLQNISSGTYLITVTDTKGCTKTASATVGKSTSVSAIKTNVNATCGNSNGSITLTVSGGTNPYSYLWNNNATTQNLQNIDSGTYVVTITDITGCSASATSIITQQNAPIVTATPGDATCGNSNGSVKLTITGTSPFTYTWSNTNTTQNISSLAANDYTVTVTDINHCTTVGRATVNQLLGPTANAIATGATCGQPNGSITLSLTGGTLPFTYEWTNGATTQNLANISGGLSYSVVITDANGCSAGANANVSQGLPPSINETTVNPACGINNGSIMLTVSGGAIPYTYSWNNNTTTDTISNIQAATYTVTVTDSDNCVATKSISISNQNSPTETETHINETCSNSNGSVDLTVIGGKTPYTYEWSSGQTTQNIDSISAGTYTVIVTDSNSCVSSLPVIITNSPPPVLSLNTVNTSCGLVNGSIALSISQGTPPFTYTWNSGQATQNIDSISSGTYIVTVTDSIGCLATSPEDTVHSSLAPQNPVLKTDNDIISVTNDTSYTSFQWYKNESIIAGATSSSYSPSGSGSYSVIVSDSEGCTAQSATNDVTTGTGDLSAYTVLIYPNPAKDVLLIEGISNVKYIRVYSPIGNMVLQAAGTLSSNKISIDISSLAPGIYCVEMMMDNLPSVTKRFVKM